MEFLFDILAEAFFEIFGEGFIALCSAFVPQKVVSEKGKILVRKQYDSAKDVLRY